MIYEIELIIGLGLIAIVALLFIKKMSSRFGDLKIENGKIIVPITDAFSGFKGKTQFLKQEESNINSKFVLFKDYIEYRIIFSTQKYGYTDIELVDLWKPFLGRYLLLTFKNSNNTFGALIFKNSTLKETIKILKKKGCKLSQNAKEFVKKN